MEAALISTRNHRAVLQKGGSAYGEPMLHICEVVMVAGQPNYLGAYCQLPAKLYFKEWEALVTNQEDTLTVDCIKFGFWVGYEGPIHTPAVCNHS